MSGCWLGIGVKWGSAAASSEVGKLGGSGSGALSFTSKHAGGSSVFWNHDLVF